MIAEKLGHGAEFAYKRGATRKRKDGEKQTNKYADQLKKEPPVTGQIRLDPPRLATVLFVFHQGRKALGRFQQPAEDASKKTRDSQP